MKLDVTAGTRFARLVIEQEIEPIERAGRRKDRTIICRCDCGSVRAYRLQRVTSGYTRSCGCLARDIAKSRPRKRHIIHGKAHTRIHYIWMAMRDRCANPKNKAFANYGGRGIRVCDRWQEFKCFYADMGDRPPGMSLDRINNDGNYEPGNCRWATRNEQWQNRRPFYKNRFIEFRGKRLGFCSWAREAGIPADTIKRRLKLGWSIDRALTQPVEVQKNNATVAQWAEAVLAKVAQS